MSHESVKQVLLDMGFFEKDGWLCNPHLGGEGTFLIDPAKLVTTPNFGIPDNFEHAIKVITVTAINHGTRGGLERGKKEAKNEIEASVKKLLKKLS